MLNSRQPSIINGQNLKFQWADGVVPVIDIEHLSIRAGERLRFLHNLIIENQGSPDMEKAHLVNKTLNHLPWISAR
jgi:hypothetical protein